MKLLKCPICGNIIEVVEDHGIPVMCCGQAMVELHANTTDAATEKHVPLLSFDEGVLTAIVGAVEHPSLAEHYINFIIAVFGNHVVRVNLKAGEKPVAKFNVGNYKGTVEVYEYCNLHGLWKAEINI